MKKLLGIVVLGLLWCNVAIAIGGPQIPAKYLQLPIDPYNKTNEAWNKGEEGHVYIMWRIDYKKMMEKF